MKFLKFIQYDVNEGIVRFWKRYLLVLLLGVTADVTTYRQANVILLRYGEIFSPIEYGIGRFRGLYPYVWDPDMMNRFEIPFQWLMIYFLLAYCIGSYVRDDMEGFGMQFMVKSGKRALWWWSKCLWAVLVNGLYFVLLFAVDVSFAWIYSGDISITIHDMSLVVLYGNQAAEMGVGGIILYTIAVPLLVGVVQSLLQMVGNIAIGSVPTMVLLSALLVLSGYYGHRMLIHGYAMVCRYIPRSAEFEYDALDVRFGLVYLAVLVVLLAAAGYIIVRKKDILEKK